MLLRPLSLGDALRLRAVLRIANVDAPAIEADRIDRAAGLDQQAERLTDLVLATGRSLDERAGGGDRRRKGMVCSRLRTGGLICCVP